MEKQWICCLLVVYVCFVLSSCGQDNQNEFEPLLPFGQAGAGDSQSDNYNSAEHISLEFNISYFGSSYDSIYISKDGIIGFVDGIRYLPKVMWSEGISNTAADRPFLAPFYHEGYDPVVNGAATYQGKIFYRIIYADELEKAKDSERYAENKELLKKFDEYVQEAVVNAPAGFTTEMAAVITWQDVTDTATTEDCDAHLGHTKCVSATFQAAIIADRKNTFVMFNYKKMDIPMKDTYQAGFNGGSERGWFSVIPCLAGCAIDNHNSSNGESHLNELPNLQGSDSMGRFFLNVGGERIVRGGCLPPNINAGLLEAYPREVGMLGGEKLEVSGKCLKATNKIYCRFGDGSNTFESEGVMTNDMKGYCPVPLMTIRGSVKLSWSSDGKDWSATRDINVVAPWNVDDVAVGSYPSEWFDPDSASISVKWSPERLSSKGDARVNIKLIGYTETPKPEFHELKNLGEVSNSDGSFTFNTENKGCTVNCQDYQMGLFEVGLLDKHHDDASNRIAFRFGPIPLGWYINKDLTKSMGSEWPAQLCRSWYGEEKKKDQSWVKEQPNCPCNLNQALADFGRWQAHPGCNMFTEKNCPIYEASHCVRSLVPSKSDAGNICCYTHDGTLMYTQLAFRGGPPTKSHALGVHPYNSPGKVPSMSYTLNDALPYFKCCYWTQYKKDICHHFTKLRPTTGCENYEVPGLAFIRGDPHITTFDGSTYEFGGKGDFWLFESEDFSIQGRFESRIGSWDLGSLSGQGRWKPVALTHVVIQGSGLPIQMYPAPHNAIRKRGLDVVVGSQRKFFYSKSSRIQEFGGDFIINNALSMTDNPHNNFTIITNNIGINVFAVNNLLHVTVALPPSMKSKTPSTEGMGLLGTFDGNADNDFIPKNKASVPANDSKALFDVFGISWAVQEPDSLFTQHSDAMRYQTLPQYFDYEDIPNSFASAPSEAQINNTCNDDVYCRWDYRITGSENVAKATREANELFSYSQSSANKVENCGLPATGDMSIFSSNDFSVGVTLEVTGCQEGHNFTGKDTFKCVKELMADAKKQSRDKDGRVVKGDDNNDYIVHWVPKPYTICQGNKTENETSHIDGDSEEDDKTSPDETGASSDSDSGSSIGLIVGIVIAVIVVIIIIVVACVCIKKRKEGSSDMEERNGHEGTAEPMMDKKDHSSAV